MDHIAQLANLNINLPDATKDDDYRLPASVLEIPEGDRGLFEQLRSDPKMSNICDEIAFNKYIRIILSREFEKWAFDSRERLIQKILNLQEKDDLSGDSLRDILPTQNMTVNQARTLSKLLETSGKLAEQHKKITEGMTINVNVNGAGIIQKLFTQVIQPCIPMDYWAACIEQLGKHAPEIGVVEETDV